MRGIGRDKFMRLLKENGLLVKKNRHSWVPGTDSTGTRQVYRNLKADIGIGHCKEDINHCRYVWIYTRERYSGGT